MPDGRQRSARPSTPLIVWREPAPGLPPDPTQKQARRFRAVGLFCAAGLSLRDALLLTAKWVKETRRAVNVEGLVARIKAAIERVQVRLDVGPAGP